jgi:hypothetical protein
MTLLCLDSSFVMLTRALHLEASTAPDFLVFWSSNRETEKSASSGFRGSNHQTFIGRHTTWCWHVSSLRQVFDALKSLSRPFLGRLNLPLSCLTIDYILINMFFFALSCTMRSIHDSVLFESLSPSLVVSTLHLSRSINMNLLQCPGVRSAGWNTCPTQVVYQWGDFLKLSRWGLDRPTVSLREGNRNPS